MHSAPSSFTIPSPITIVRVDNEIDLILVQFWANVEVGPELSQDQPTPRNSHFGFVALAWVYGTCIYRSPARVAGKHCRHMVLFASFWVSEPGPPASCRGQRHSSSRRTLKNNASQAIRIISATVSLRIRMIVNFPGNTHLVRSGSTHRGQI